MKAFIFLTPLLFAVLPAKGQESPLATSKAAWAQAQESARDTLNKKKELPAESPLDGKEVKACVEAKDPLVRQLIELAEDADTPAEARRSAIKQLSEVGAKRDSRAVVLALGRIADEKNIPVAYGALSALETLAKNGQAYIAAPEILRQMQHPDSDIAAFAVDRIDYSEPELKGALRKQAVTALLALVDGGAFGETRHNAIFALRRFLDDSRSEPALRKVLADKDWRARNYAALGLLGMGVKLDPAPLIGELSARVVEGKEDNDRTDAGFFLELYAKRTSDPTASQAIAGILPLLQDVSPFARERALVYLTWPEVKEKASIALDPLRLAAAKERDPHARLDILKAIREIEEAQKP